MSYKGQKYRKHKDRNANQRVKDIFLQLELSYIKQLHKGDIRRQLAVLGNRVWAAT